MVSAFDHPLQAQGQVTQSVTVGVVFVEFSDADTDIESRGGVGYTAPPRQIDPDKYQAQYWYDFFFKEEGHVSHPDSVTHENQWSGGWAPYQLGSVSRWSRENSYGQHGIEPYSSNGRDGILNTYDANGKIEWLRLSKTKQELSHVQSMNNPLVMETTAELNTLFSGLPDLPTETCDVIIIIYAGLSFGTYFSLEAPGFAVASEKTPYQNSWPDAILNLSMAGIIHEYVHAASNFLLDKSHHPSGFINDYGYDSNQSGVKRSRWLGITAMYAHGVPSRPMHLDPWAKLMLDWIDYQILGPGDYSDISLPVIAQPSDGIVPHVLVIPIDVPWTEENPDWYRGHYLIVENRRRISNSFDMTITDVASPGGILVWEYDERLIQGKRGGLTVIEADGQYDMKFIDRDWVENERPPGTPIPYHLFNPSADDFWSAPSVLSTWSQHVLGLLDPATMKNSNYEPALSRTVPRQITIRFGEYTDSGDENVIPWISVGAPTSNVPTATRNNNQRKLIKQADELLFVATADFAGGATEGTITVYTSPDAGEHWTELHLLNDFDVWRDLTEVAWDPNLSAEDQDLNRWLPSVAESGATAPAIARIDDSWGVVWQLREGGGESRVLFATRDGQTVDVAGGNIARADDDVKPVIDWGRYDQSVQTEILKIVYCSDDGLVEVVSTDNGVSFETPALISGTGAASINPSLAMNVNHEILVYEEEEEIFAIINGDPPVNLSALHPEFLRNLSPSVTLTGSTAHVVWTAEVYEYIPDIDRHDYHIKPVHKVFDVAAVSEVNVSTFTNIKYGRLEEARHPVIATKYTQGNSFEAVMMWSVFDGIEGARLRYNEFAWNPATGQYEWTTESTESALSSQPTYHPAIAGDDGDTRFIVTRGTDVPYRIESGAPAPLIPDPYVGEKEVLISLLDTFDDTWQNSVLLGDVVISSQGQTLGRAANAGVPFAGFDGSHDGPPLSLLSMSEEILLHEQDALSWTLHVHRMPTNRYSDTTVFSVNMYDALDSTVIATVSGILIPPGKIDTTFTVDILLPPSHYPAAPVRLSLDVSGDAYDNGLRYYTATKNIYSTSDVRKQSRRERERVTVVASTPSIEAFPQPATTTLQLVHPVGSTVRATVTLHDYLGRIVRRVAADGGGDGMLRMQLDVADLRPGVYDCRITTKGGTARRMVSILR
ncbi:MAG: T9SS type A sorting domain-containing protein [Bacteroidetes bacterium]|nr:T9SS type A sorting domain-containing protein [Bacteroidota bacterium]